MHHHAEKGCSFCAFSVDLEQIIAETKHFWITRNIFPYGLWDDHEVAEHLLLVPKQHTESIRTFNSDEKIEFVDIVGEYEAEGYSVYARSPGNKSKTIPHQHTHLIKLKGKAKRFNVRVNKPYLLLYR